LETTVGGLIRAAARRYGAKTALIVGGATYSYAALDEQSSILAAHLEQMGFQKGDVISLCAPNSAEWIISYYAILKMGGVVNPLNLMLTPKEVAYAMKDCGAKAILGAAENLAALSSLADEGMTATRIAWGEPVPKATIQFTDLQTWPADVEPEYPVSGLQAIDTCSVSYTSGTTGHPKGALLTHGAILMNVEMTSVMHARTHEDVIVSALPCSHVYGNVVMQSTFSHGGTLVLHAAFDAERIAQSIETHRATLLEGVPTMYMYLLNFGRLDQFDLSSLTRCTVGGQTMPVSKLEDVERVFGCPILELWGMTEIGGLGTTHTFYGPHKLGSIGIAMPHVEIRIAAVDDPTAPIETGQVGELQVRGPITMREYIGNSAATAEVLLESGWLRTGDLAYIDAEGFAFIVDRLKDLIITAGFNIYPAELERVIAAYPGVAMVAVGSVADDDKGELAKAYIVQREDAQLDLEDLRRYCRENLAAYKVPRAFQLVPDLPKTSTGKIMRRALRQLDSD